MVHSLFKLRLDWYYIIIIISSSSSSSNGCCCCCCCCYNRQFDYIITLVGTVVEHSTVVAEIKYAQTHTRLYCPIGTVLTLV